MRGGIRERTDDLELFYDGPRPAMGDDDRQGIRMTRADVDEVNVEAIDRVMNCGKASSFASAFRQS